MPIVWVGRIYGFTQIGRVYGPDLMYEICKVSIEKKYTHFLYGGKPGVADLLRINLRNKLPGVHIVGTYTPPFRPLNKYEEESLIQQVKKAKPDFFWVGLSTPKQEKFMANYISKLDTKVMLGVGAAFDIHTGLAKDAPRFIKIISLQWLYRLYQEPRRLWRRYLVNVPLFICKIALQIIGDIFKSQMKVKSK
jgi:N-acetylglucosaminyldiphosphoundecaprenol N-acetyl-beta-D-mannosaminyltransferase